MESFSYHHHHPFLVDSAYSPNTPIEMPIIQQEVGEITNLSSCFPYYYYPFKATPELSTTDPSSSLDSARDFPSPQPTNMEKKRKNHSVTSLSSVQSKVTKEIKNKKQRKPSCGLKQTEEVKQTADDELEAIEASEELPGGYIHVRARRGQATDSHSLAERVRREKISERMKMLQDLVPGCDKVTGKALVLEEIINYVQSLQNQIEFLSMKLASFSPILHDMGEGYDDCMNQQERMGRIMPQPMPSHIQPITTVDNTANSYPMMGSSASLLLHGKVPTNFSQDEECFLVQVGEQRQGYFNSVGFNNNMCSFQ